VPLAFLFFLVVVGTGLGALRVLRLHRAWLGLGLAPAAGLAVASSVSTWAGMIPLPEPLGLAVLLAASVAGFATAMPRLRGLSHAPAVSGVLALAVLVPLAVLGLTFGNLEVPFSGHDGAHHVETIAALERGARWAGWYPPGFHATLAAFISLAPWVDTARGVLDAAFGVALLAPLAVFGLGYVLIGRPGVAALGALFLAFTIQYPYSPQLWSGWPVATALLLALGLWSVGALYLRRPTPRLTVLAGLLLGSILLMHGTELYTAAIGLVVLLIAGWRRLAWPRLARDLLLAGAIAGLTALPYLATLVGWVTTGGATQAAQEVLQIAASDQPSVGEVVITLALGSLSGGFMLDLPIRAGLLAIGLWSAVRNTRERVVASIFVIFFGLALAFRYASLPGLSTLYTLTFPWAEWIRLLMVAAVAASLLQANALAAIRAKVRLPRLPRVPLAASLTAAGLLLLGCTWGTSRALGTASAPLATYSADDAAAMAWLRAHAQPGEVVANDRSGDAGIWAPYKANVRILAPRLGLPGADERSAQEQLLGSIGQLDRVADAVCRLHVRYVYRGAHESQWEPRHFPSLDELRASPALEEVFTSGEAAIFRVLLPCEP
jgi:hypothetical protein